jgi:fructose-1,6-bisphosphatase/inositol monophosphatase family enzyme
MKRPGTRGSIEGEEYLWIIDPLDGTTNFLRGIPHFAVGIACKVRGRLEHAVLDRFAENSPSRVAALN